MLADHPAIVPVPKRECLVENHISTELRKVRRFGGFARGLCVAFGGYCGVALLPAVIAIAFGWGGPFRLGAFSVPGGQFTPLLLVWAAFVLVSAVIPGFMGLRHMYALFDNL